MEIEFSCIKDIEQAKKVWQNLEEYKIICDDWNFRICFYQHFEYELFFYVASVGGEVVGLLPLQYNSDTKCLEFFGATLMEDNRPYVKPGYEYVIPELYKQITLDAELEFIRIDQTLTQTQDFSLFTYRYFLNIQEYHELEDYLKERFDGEGRGKMRRKIKHIEKEEIEIQYNKIEDIESLFAFNKENFAESSTFHKKGRQESFRKLPTLGYDLYLLSFYQQGILQGVSLSLGNKGVYEYINLGVRAEAPRDLRAYIHLKNIEIAIQRGYDVFNAFAFDCGWKELFHLDKTPQYKFDKTP